MNVPHTNIAVAAAARLVLNDLAMVPNDTRASSKELDGGIIPFSVFVGIERFADEGGGLNKLLRRLRNSLLAPGKYLRAKELFVEALGITGPAPPNWRKRLNIIEKYEIGNIVIVESWREIVRDIRDMGFETP